jgi:hypothetical protein
MAMTDMERHVIASIKERYGQIVDLDTEPGVILEILRRYKNDLDRTEAMPDEYVQVRTGAVGGVGQASRAPSLASDKAEVQLGEQSNSAAGEITNTELMRELLRIRKELSALTNKIP